jgi:hypothetical protein
VGWFEGDDDSGALLANQNYFTPAGLPFHATENAVTSLYSGEIENGKKLNGILYGFTTSDNKKYEAKIINNKFYGYYLAGSNTPYNDQTNFSSGTKIKVKTMNYVGNCQVEFYERDYSLTSTINNQTYTNGLDIITNFNATAGKKLGSPSVIPDCIPDYNADLQAGTIGKTLFDTYLGNITSGDTASVNELKRIGNLVNKLGPDLFKSYYQKEDWRTDYQSDMFVIFHYQFKALESPNTWDKTSLRATFLNIKKYADAVHQFKLLTTSDNFTTTQLKTIVNQNFVCCNDYKYLFKTPFLQLGANQRNNILKVFLNDTWVTGRLGIGDDFKNEDIILSTITTATATSQHKEILNFLKNNGLIYKLVKNVDGDNYDAITTTLTKWILEEFPVPTINLNELLQQKRLIHFNDNYFFGKQNTEQILQNNKIVLVVQSWNGNVDYSVICEPYDYIEVTFENNFELGSGTSKASFVKSTPYKLPAFYVYMLFNSDTRAKWLKSAKITVDVGLLVIGVGEIKAAIQAGEWATASLAVADMGIGFADIVINTAFKNEIQNNYPKFFDAWQKISFCYGIGRIAQVGLTAAYKRCVVESQIIKNKNTYSQTTKSTAQQIDAKLQDPANFAEFIDQPALASELTFFTNVDNNYSSVTNKIGKMDDENRLAFYDEFKNNPNNILDDFNQHPNKVDEWVQTRQTNLSANLISREVLLAYEFYGIKAKRIKDGVNGKVAIIGQSMGDFTKRGEYGVVDYARELRAKGYETELFAGPRITDAARTQLDNLKAALGRDLTPLELETTIAYKDNMAWAKWVKDEGFTVIDIGNPNNKPYSHFYSGECVNIFGN